jgi:hypothetical protein
MATINTLRSRTASAILRHVMEETIKPRLTLPVRKALKTKPRSASRETPRL